VEAIGQLDPTNVIIVGGTQAVAPSVETALEALSGVATVNRIDGPTRQDTAIELANVLTDTTIGGFKDRFIVASGVNFPDALVAGPFAGQVGAPILLSVSATSLGTNSANTIKAADGTPPPNITHATLLGGTVALSDAVGADTGAAFLARN
jgi:putative cell wall-binding protein